jgi:hypothetical protein
MIGSLPERKVALVLPGDVHFGGCRRLTEARVARERTNGLGAKRLRNLMGSVMRNGFAYTAVEYTGSAVRVGNVDLEASRDSIEKAKALECELAAQVWLRHDL